MRAKVYLIDDQPEVLALLSDLLQRRGREAAPYSSGERALEALERGDPEAELVILDLDLGPGRLDGLAVLARLKERYPDLPVIMLTGKGTVEDAVKAMRLGATDFVEKDPRLDQRLDLQMVKLDRMLQVLRDNRRLRRQNTDLQDRAGWASEMVGNSRAMRAVRDKIAALADIPRPVLILGERGAGKELVAVALHRAGKRCEGPFVTVNCAAVPESLAESELFGHEKGAFTDAREARPGRFELADGGTLFLDEVGNMPLPVQQKILRAIEYRTFERVRGNQPLQVDVRVCAATNADLQTEMQAGRFRRDLYDRLTFDTIDVPPLRERREDIPDLCAAFLKRFRNEVATVRCQRISPEVLEALAEQPFPGNVRELKNLVERAAYRCRGEVLTLQDLEFHHPEPGAETDHSVSFHAQAEAFERHLLQEALSSCGGNLGRAAKRLGLGYDQMRRLVKKHRLRPAGSGDP